ncbi:MULTISPECIES: hypothetical protein [Cupriavidus]
MADLKALWAEIRPQLKNDLDRAAFIEGKLDEMFKAFDEGERERGRDAVWAIYNLRVQSLS